MVVSTEHSGAAIGVTGLAVMGRNLARNLAWQGYPVAVQKRSPERTRALIGGDVVGDYVVHNVRIMDGIVKNC
jgi:6-phosphogluconate dehydrogenase